MFAQGAGTNPPLYPPEVQLRLSVFVYATDYLARRTEETTDVVQLAKDAYSWIVEKEPEANEALGGQYI